MRYSVTGESDLSAYSDVDRIKKMVEGYIRDLVPTPTEFTTGAAYGIDSIAATVAWTYLEHPIVLRVCEPKGQRFNEGAREWGFVIEEVEGGYMARNDRLVEHSDVLLAFPRSWREELRSGTWATVRRARKAGIEIRYFPLNGRDKPWIESAR